MPKTSREMTDVEVRKLRHPGGKGNAKFNVGGVPGLQLQITPNGKRSWVLRTIVGEKRREIGLGSYHPTKTTLKEARERAFEAREAIRRGVDPIEERKAARAALVAAQRRGLTFSKAVERYWKAHVEGTGNEKASTQWRATLDQHAGPHIGEMLVGGIGVSDVLRVLEPVWADKNATASRLRGRIENVLSWATTAGHREAGENPARWAGNLEHLLAAPGKVRAKAHQPALALEDAARWFAALRETEGIPARALEFAALTAARSGEVLGAVWSEVNFSESLWTIPAERMKRKREHRVPLTVPMLDLLRAVRGEEEPDGGALVFPAPRGGRHQSEAVNQIMQALHADAVAAGGRGYLDSKSGRPAVPHGLRSCFRDWAGDRTSFERDLIEMALAHALGSATEAAYRRGDALAKRGALMEAWGRFLSGEAEARVVPLADRRA